jgi:hypothetical protein
MKVLVDILKDSQAHYLNVQSKIQKRLESISHGSVFKRRIRGSDYYYLNFRQGRKVISKYIGKQEPSQILKEIKERRLLLNRLKEVRQSLALISRVHLEKPLATKHR